MASNILNVRPAATDIEQVLIGGDLSRLDPEQRVSYYDRVCTSLGLNPLTKPFEYLTLNGKLILYCKRDATDQLRKINGVSIKLSEPKIVDGVCVVRAEAVTRDGRTDESTGAVSIIGLKGEALANAMMKTESKSKRRVTLSICGLGWLDETEIGGGDDHAPPPPRPTRAMFEKPKPSLEPAARELVDDETGEVTEDQPDDLADWTNQAVAFINEAKDAATIADNWTGPWAGTLKDLKANRPDLYARVSLVKDARKVALGK
jgi:hypothetical protein